ncbi:lipopolysaccharide biosynthesis protein [Oerskovia enterophila]|uniref:lipopolysaccharide biosynthesis protein n=1 Tax=Oerskovia enterophila TaxID=43678 RepID=UPI0037F5C5BA
MIQVGVIMVALGMGAAITREYILGSAGASGARGLVAQSTVISVLLAGFALATGRWWAPALLGRPWDTALLLSVLASLGGGIVIVAQSYLRGAERPVPFVLLAAGGTLAGPAVGLCLIASGARSGTLYLAALAGGYLLAGLAGIVIAFASGPRAASWRGLLRALRLGVPTVPHQVALYLAIAGLVVVADRILDAGGTANVVLTLGAGATVLTGALNNAWAPLIYKQTPDRRLAVLTSTTRTILLVVAVLVSTVALTAPFLVRVATPPGYDHAEMSTGVVLAALSAVPSVYYLASSHLILVRGRTGALSVTTPLAVGSGLLLATVLVPVWGIAGIGLSYTAIYVLMALFTTAVQALTFSPRWGPPAPLLPLVVTGVSTCAALALPETAWGTGLRLVLLVAVLLGCARPVLRWLRPVRPDSSPA